MPLPLPYHPNFMLEMCLVRLLSFNQTLVFISHKGQYDIYLKISEIPLFVRHFLLNRFNSVLDTKTCNYCHYGCYVTITLIRSKISRFPISNSPPNSYFPESSHCLYINLSIYILVLVVENLNVFGAIDPEKISINPSPRSGEKICTWTEKARRTPQRYILTCVFYLLSCPSVCNQRLGVRF